MLANRWWQTNRCTRISAPRFLHLPRAQAVCSLPCPPRQLGPRLPPSPARARCGELEARDLQLLTYGYDVLQRVSRARMLWSEWYAVKTETKGADPEGKWGSRQFCPQNGLFGIWQLLSSGPAISLVARTLACVYCHLGNCGWRAKDSWTGTTQRITETILFATTTQL